MQLSYSYGARVMQKDSARPSLVVYLPNLASGGVERMHINMAPLFMEAGYDVTFLLQEAKGELMPLVPPGVRVVDLDCSRTIACLLPVLRFLKRERPAIMLSSMGHNNIIAIAAHMLARTPTRIIVSFHNALSQEKAAKRSWNYKILPLLCHLLLKYAHAIVAVSKGVANDLAAVSGAAAECITVIYNPVIADDFDARLQAPLLHPWLNDSGPPLILGVGRFVAQKDFATLIAAFAIVAVSTDARLMVLGEGPQRPELMALAESLGIVPRMSMPGFVENPLPFMRSAAAFVLSSRYEGFGNVIAEALASGTPVISTDCPYGPAEILENGRFGTLVPVGDYKAMASAIIKTLADNPDKAMLQSRGREFSIRRAAQSYITLFA